MTFNFRKVQIFRKFKVFSYFLKLKKNEFFQVLRIKKENIRENEKIQTT